MTVDLTLENQALLQQAAATMHRSESDLANEAMHWYLSTFAAPDEDEHNAKMVRARQQIAEGRTIDHEDLFAEIFAKLER